MNVLKFNNLILVISDQHKTDTTGCYGHPVVKTPNLDMFAREGVLFTQAYCQSPLCAPSRGSLMTGLHCHTAGTLTQRTPIRRDVATIGSVFREAGYKTAAFGKMHVIGEDEQYDLGFTERGLRYFTYNLRDYIEVVGEEKARKYRTGYQEFMKASYNPGNQPLDLKEEEMFDTLVVDRSIEFLKNNKSERFFLHIGLEKPHPDWYVPPEYHEQYPVEDVILPEGYNQPLKDVPTSMIKRQSYLETYTYSENEARSCIAAYYANVTYMDKQFGRIIEAIKKLGLYDNTLIVYTSDHGEILFEHGWTQKHCFFESAVSVPLIMVNTTILPIGKVQKGIVSLIDLFPTFTDLFGLSQPEGLEGKSIIPLLQGKCGLQDRAAFSEYYWTCDPARMIRTPEWKYIYTLGEVPQLYNMKDDLGEKQNLALVPDYKSVCQELEERLMEGWEIPELPIDLTAIEFRYKMKEEYLRKKALGLHPEKEFGFTEGL